MAALLFTHLHGSGAPARIRVEQRNARRQLRVPSVRGGVMARARTTPDNDESCDKQRKTHWLVHGLHLHFLTTRCNNRASTDAARLVCIANALRLYVSNFSWI